MSATFFKPDDLAALYKIPLTTMWKYLRQGKFKGAIRIGRTYRIPYEAKVEFEKNHRIERLAH